MTAPDAVVSNDAAGAAPTDAPSDPPVHTPATPLGIICGSGTIPFAIADMVRGRGRRVVLFALRGWAQPTAVAPYPHHWIALGQFGRICRLARQEGCRELVFVGGLIRPSILQLRLDWGTVMQMPLIIRSFRGGDDHLLSGVGRLFESGGFRIVGAHEVAPEITAPLGVLGRHRPDADVDNDIERGFALLAATSAFDVGIRALTLACEQDRFRHGSHELYTEMLRYEIDDTKLVQDCVMATSGAVYLADQAGVLLHI